MHFSIARNSNAQQVNIEWPLQSLFHYVCDIETYPAWQPDLVSTEWKGYDRHVPGACFTEVRYVNGKREESLATIQRYIPFRERTHIVCRGSWKVAVTLTFVELLQATAIQVDVVVTTTEPLRWVSTMLAERMRQTWTENLSRLKVQLEAENGEAEPSPEAIFPEEEEKSIT